MGDIDPKWRKIDKNFDKAWSFSCSRGRTKNYGRLRLLAINRAQFSALFSIRVDFELGY